MKIQIAFLWLILIIVSNYGQTVKKGTALFIEGLPELEIAEFNHLSPDNYQTAVLQGISHYSDYYLTVPNNYQEETGIWLLTVSQEGTYKIENIQFNTDESNQKQFSFPAVDDNKVVKCKIVNAVGSYQLSYEVVIKKYPEWDAGIVIESFVINGTKKNGGENENIFYPLSIYYNGAILFDENYRFEIRPGYFVGGEYFGGLELGVYLRRNVYNAFFAAAGFLVRYNTGLGHGTAVYETIEEDFYPALALTAGLILNDEFSLLVTYNKSTKEKFGYRIHALESINSTGSDIRRVNINMFSVIKLGFLINI